MLTKNQVKFVTSLADKRARTEEGLFIAEGVKIVEELLRSSIKVKQVFAVKEWIKTEVIGRKAGLWGRGNESMIQEPEVTEVSEAELNKISQLATPNKVLAVAVVPEWKLDADTLKQELVLVMDDVRDPGNLGTILRIADWFGIGNVICSMNSADAYNPKVVQATMGSIARVKVHYTDIGRVIASVRDSVPVYGAVLGGENIYSEELSDKGWIVIGNESKGISPGVMQLLTDKITIPSFSEGNPLGGAESLNAAIAAAVICSEFRRRKLLSGK
jgi:RNA methyltransferase, TrmH family